MSPAVLIPEMCERNNHKFMQPVPYQDARRMYFIIKFYFIL